MSAAGIRAGRAFVEIGADSARLDAALVRLRAKLGAFGAGLATIGGGLVGASAGLTGLLAWPLKLAANMETAEAQFATMLKSTVAAKTLLSDLQRFAASTPFEFPELADAARKLLAFGSIAGNIEGELTMLGDISAGIGVPIGELAEIYGKARVQGRLFAEDVNQLTGRGIPVIQEFAKQFGVTDTQVKKLVESGKIGFDQLEKALRSLTTAGKGITLADLAKALATSESSLESMADAGQLTFDRLRAAFDSMAAAGQGVVFGDLVTAMGITEQELEAMANRGELTAARLKQALASIPASGGTFAGGMVALSRTYAGMLSTLRDNIGNALRPFGEALLPIAKQVTDTVSAIVLLLGKFAERNKAAVTYVAGTAAALAVLGAAFVGVGGSMVIATTLWGGFMTMGSMLAGVATAVAGVGGAILAGLLSPIGLTVAAIAVVITAMGGWRSAWESIRQVAGSVAGYLAVLFDPVIQKFASMGNTLTATWRSVITAISSGQLEAAFDVATAGLSVAWSQAMTAMRAQWNEFVAGFVDRWIDANTYYAQNWVHTVTGFKVAWEQAVTWFGTQADTIGVVLSQAFDMVRTDAMNAFDAIIVAIQQANTFLQEFLLLSTREAGAQTRQRLQQELEQRQAERRAGYNVRTFQRNEQLNDNSRAAASRARLDAIANEQVAWLRQLERMNAEQKAAQRRGDGRAEQEAAKRLQEAQQRLAQLRDQIEQQANAQKTAIGDKVKEAGAAAQTAKAAGAFDASKSSQQIGLTSVQQQIQKNTAQTAQAVTKLAERQGLVFA